MSYNNNVRVNTFYVETIVFMLQSLQFWLFYQLRANSETRSNYCSFVDYIFFSILKMRKFILVDLRGSSLTSQQYKLPRFSPCFIALSSVKTGMLMFFGEPLFFSAQPLNLSSVLHLDTLQTQFICKILILIEEERLEPNFYLLSSIVS